MGSDSLAESNDSYGTQTWTFVDEAPKSKSTSLPVLLSAAALVLGAILALVSWGLPEGGFPMLPALGYLLTPLATALLLAWALARHRVASASDSYDMAAGHRLVKVAIAIALVGFVVGALLTFRIGVWVAQLPSFNGGTS